MGEAEPDAAEVEKRRMEIMDRLVQMCQVTGCDERARVNVRTQRGENLDVCDDHKRSLLNVLVGKPLVGVLDAPGNSGAG